MIKYHVPRLLFQHPSVLDAMSIANPQSKPANLQRLDEQSVGAVFDQYFSEIYRFVLYRVGDPALAEDFASDVFIRLLEAVKAARGPESNLKGWLIGTASHIVTDHFRKKYRHPEDEIPTSLRDVQPDIPAQIEHREQNTAVRDAMARLTAEQQHVLSLRFGQGYSLEETAHLMNKNANAIKALQFRALAALQREIGEANL